MQLLSALGRSRWEQRRVWQYSSIDTDKSHIQGEIKFVDLVQIIKENLMIGRFLSAEWTKQRNGVEINKESRMTKMPDSGNSPQIEILHFNVIQ